MTNRTGKLLQKARIKAKMTQLKLAQELGYENPQFVSLVENGHSKPPLRYCRKAIVSLGMNKAVVREALLRDYNESLDSEL